MNKRLADFIRAEMEPILQNWEEFAKTIFNAQDMDKSELRDHAKRMLLEIADDLDSHQSKSEQVAKSKGREQETGEESGAEEHGSERQISGFSVNDTISEFRALRASVVSLWIKAYPTITDLQLEDLIRFNEAIDQAISESLNQYATKKEMDTRLFGTILVTSPDPTYVLDLEGRFLYANKATANLFGLRLDAIIGKSTFDLGFSFASDFTLNLEKAIADKTIYRGNFIYTFASSQGDRFAYMLAPVVNEEQNTEAIVCIVRDVTEQALAEEKSWHNAHHDPLTGLPNRRLFLDRLEQEVKHSSRNSLSLAVLFMDLDGFKDVNDTLGHDVGDHLLSEVAKRLTDCVRAEDTVARLGGDEFTVILLGAEKHKDVELVAQGIIDALALPFDIAPQPVEISVSVGIAFYPQDASASVALLEAADQAMYKAKKSGANRMCFFTTLDSTDRYTA